MKQISTKLSIMLAICLPVLAFSQNNIESKTKTKKDQINIRIEKEVDGKREVIEKRIDASNMTSQEREAAVQKFQDSLMAGEKGKQHRLKIEIADDNMEMKSGDMNDDREIIINKDRDVIVKKSPKNRQYQYKFYNNDDNFDGKWEQKLDRGLDNMGRHLDKLGYDIDRRIMVYKDKASKKSPKIHGLEVYPNNPKVEVLNISFKAPDKGDVAIRVLDVKGNVVAKEDVKDFSGEYVGQINIGKAGKGTYFVMVTQNEDGVTKRVVIPAQE
jgi:Secretion system C-terminal sorting domain